jgi:hypothetical protein
VKKWGVNFGSCLFFFHGFEPYSKKDPF